MKAFFLSAVIVLLTVSCSEPKGTHAPTDNAQRYLKPGAPIHINGESFIELAQGESRELAVRFSSSQSKGSALISVSADSGLQVVGLGEYSFDLSEPVSIPLEISAGQNGTYYVHFHAHLDGMIRAMAYRVQVGAPPPVQQKTTANDGIKTFNAQETIIKN